MFNLSFYTALAFSLFFAFEEIKALPNLNETSQETIIVFSGEDALIDCKVENQENYTVVFKYVDHDSQTNDVISAGNIRITSDTRFSILHHSEHEVWVLKITDSQPNDSGVYMCEVNSNPKQQIARILNVVTPEESSDSDDNPKTKISNLNHNYTNCCVDEGVPEHCLNFCHMTGLVSNQIPQQTIKSCLQYLPSITQCLNGGRNNLGCCERQNVPKTCLNVCVGNFSLTTITDHFTCLNYAAPMLACIAEGLTTLPAQPQDITVEAISTSEMVIKWKKPNSLTSGPIDSYQINITQLHTFDSLDEEKRLSNMNNKDKSMPSMYGLELSVVINATFNEYLVKNLKPLTMYETRITSLNKFGSSLPSNAIRVITLPPPQPDTKLLPKNPNKEPKLPDIRKCCVENGVTLDRCLDTLCDPTKADTASLSDLMICAPWANVTFKCMSIKSNEDGYMDHSDCCKQRGVSSVCLPLCQGSVKRIDFRYFVCLDHMSAYTSCILEYHKVLPSEPQDFVVSDVHHDWALLKWKPPKKLSETVDKYYIHWREVASETSDVYQIEISTRSPYLIDNLRPGQRYETYVTAVNKYGVSQGSVRIVFSTPDITPPEEIELEDTISGYNETACCVRASLSNTCLPLCSYKVKVADVFNLSAKCVNSLPILVRCAAGGRNHVSCCRRRGVTEACLNVCAGLIDSSSYVIAAKCTNDFGRIIQCMEEGSNLLPGMPLGLHTNYITKDSVQIEWKPAIEDNEASHISYQVRYGKSENLIPLHPLEHTNSVNASDTKQTITGLEPDSHYSIYVTAHNLYGVSLPSLVLLVKTLESDQNNSTSVVKARIGPPHSLEVMQQNVDSITFKWLPPLYLPIDKSIKYIIYFKAINGTAAIAEPSKDSWFTATITYTTIYLSNLTYNTEYAIAVQAKTDQNETSALSEVVLAWTDPPIPAAVQMPVIIPAGPIVEGSNVTILCVAMGTPVPVLSMFVNGHLAAKQRARHLATSVVKVNRNLTTISCYATNGAGKHAHSAQSSLDIHVRFKPIVKALPQISSAAMNGTARLICEVSSNPHPKVSWFKQSSDDTVIMSSDSNVDILLVAHSDLPLTWIYTLIIKRTTNTDFGHYMCTAENQYGKDVESLTLEMASNSAKSRNTSECCAEQGIHSDCLDVCSLDVDIETALTRPECYAELDKLMICAADGSDHRQCCRRRQVPNGCLRWCAGLKVAIPSLCILSSARDIISCFQEGKALLPGPPTNVHVEKFMDNNNVIIEWSPPEKNSELVQWYRVFWRPVGSRDLMRNQTDKPYFELQALESNKMYEFVVKSGNHYGLSIFTDPLVVSARGAPTYSTSLGNKFLKVMLGITVGIVLIICIIGVSIYYYKYYYLTRNHQTRGVSFENPTYLKDSGSIQIHDSRVASNAATNDGTQANANKLDVKE